MARADCPQLISLERAKGFIMEMGPIGTETVSIEEALGRIAIEEVRALCSCPSVDSSLKDGFAVVSEDLQKASLEAPVRLSVKGSVTAGDQNAAPRIGPGETVRIMTGSRIPEGASAVLASEFARQVSGQEIEALADAETGRNILRRGSDIAEGEIVVKPGQRLSPCSLGLLAAAGIGRIKVARRPRVAVAATGSELVPPGRPIGPGQVAASNMVSLAAELKRLGISATCVIFRDNLEALKARFEQLLSEHDVILTCGGVLDGDKDFTVRAMEDLGVKMEFRRVRMGPGKGICMGRLDGRVIFNLPGGPPSNHVAAQVLAIPGIRRLMGWSEPFPVRLQAVLERDMRGQRDWTKFEYVALEQEQGLFHVKPPTGRSRLMRMAWAAGLAELPEGTGHLKQGDTVEVWMTNWTALA
jgi:molybdopterin molybdotransferase